MRAILPNDTIICYVTKVSLFVAVGRASATGCMATRPFWGVDYPVQLPVALEVVLNLEAGIDARELLPRLPMFADILRRSPGSWGSHFMASPRRLPSQDGAVIVAAIRDRQ